MANRFVIRTQTRRDLWIQVGIVLLLSLVLVLLFFFVYLPWTTNHGESITVPDLKGMKLEELEDYLAERDLRYEVQDSAFDLEAPPLSVKEQYPKAGAKVKEGRKIYLTVIAKNPRMVTMPELKDMSIKSVEMALKRARLRMGDITYKPHLGPFVLEQSVAAGQKIPEGSAVDLVIGNGQGANDLKAPDLLGKTAEEAKFVIEASGLNLGVPITASDTAGAAGTVIRQNPLPGTSVKSGDFIDIWIVPGGAGPPPN